jgi:hypothetical protein
MKWQIGAICLTAIAVGAIYAGANEPPAIHYDAAACENRLNDLRLFKLGIEPRGAPFSAAGTAQYVERCASLDRQFAADAAAIIN